MKINMGGMFARKFDSFELVYNTKKNIVQMVLAEVPFNKRAECGMPKMKRSYICSTPKGHEWEFELAENLRPTTIFERV